MKKILIVYWSSSGNTEIMAKQIAEGASEAGAEVMLKNVSEAKTAMVKDADALAFVCPAMGDEVLEEGEMEPFISGLGEADLSGKALGLFGSYDWGGGQWMRNWVERMKKLGALVAGEGIIAQLEPSADVSNQCRELGKQLAG